jgi:hypothetical protein
MDARSARIGRIVAGVLAEAVRTTKSNGLLIVDDGSPETKLLLCWCKTHLAGQFSAAEEAVLAEKARAERRLTARATNKTALLLAQDFPRERVLPLGDLYATQVGELAGDFSLPADVQGISDAAGGIEALDGALEAHFGGWLPAQEAADRLPAAARGPFLEAVQAGRFSRERAGLVPKLSTRTIGIDLFG